MTIEAPMAPETDAENNDIPEAKIKDIGEILKDKRIELGIDQQYAASELKLSIDQVQALEKSDFAYFRSSTFTRGFLKGYCRLLKLDDDLIIKRYDNELSGQSANIKPVDQINHQKRLGDPIVILVTLFIIAVVAFLLFWWPHNTVNSITDSVLGDIQEAQISIIDGESNSNNTEELVVEDDTATDSTLVDTTPETVESLEEVKNVDSESSSNDGSLTSTTTGAEEPVVAKLSSETVTLLEEAGLDPDEVAKATQEATTKESVEVAEEETPAFYLDDIQITYVDDCWTEIRDASGAILFSGVKVAGSKLTLTTNGPYRVVFGYAAGVESLTYKGELFDFSSFTRQNLARFELN